MSTCIAHTGTILVRPEPVDNGKDDFRGPEFRSRKTNVLRKEFSRRRAGQSLLVCHKIATSSLLRLPFLQHNSSHMNPFVAGEVKPRRLSAYSSIDCKTKHSIGQSEGRKHFTLCLIAVWSLSCCESDR